MLGKFKIGISTSIVMLLPYQRPRDILNKFQYLISIKCEALQMCTIIDFI